MEGFQLLPVAPGLCPTCATKHEPGEPHNQQSLFYQYRFYSQRGRWPTWKDAVEHCEESVRSAWENALKERGVWTEPTSEVPDVLPTPRHTIGTVKVIPLSKKRRKAKK